ncbi:metal ABC transporter substrate-binding protein [Stenotrophobium rhamnosiphilum]|uniref:Zinc ABC transporter substrate-binding protein n=1 Tax=Stenotrophobium rhamnosiphilum TaxID=2029166 RepID=A0A2T5MCU0_9GAMM|nr:zinc ABC transporter substrate-binding protein [Stenotrophobium rhamnosiphilum]PTU30367.1 zinc ABC transporter substrate-binding protein [Stenotrophobium rhamnosiphilum]
MKKIFALSIALMASSFTLPAQAALKVFACEPEWAALSKELGGANVDVYAATTALQDVHKIQPRPSLIAKYRQADLVVCTGAELEVGWLPPLAEKGNNPKVNPGTPGYFEASRFISMMEVPSRLDRSDGDVHAYGNPHVQTAPDSIAAVAKGLADKFAEVDAAHAADYKSRYQQFNTKWTAAMQKWAIKGKPLNGTAVVSSHKGWSYMYRWLGMQEVATLEPKPGIPPSAAHLEDVLATLKAKPAKMVVFAAYQDRRPADWLSEHANIPAVELPFSVGGVAGTDDLFGLFDVTLDRLLAALQGKK